MPVHLVTTVVDKLSKALDAIEQGNQPEAEFQIHELQAVGGLLAAHPRFMANGGDRGQMIEATCVFLRALAATSASALAPVK